MNSRKETERAKLIQDKCQTYLTQMLRDEDNKYCVDCDAKGPRWASWNLGVFLCIRCAGIHRNLGVHISRVKSVNLDTWTPEQVVSLQQMGNSRARAVFEAQLPDGFRRPQTDTSLESFIRAKYEHKKYLAREWVPQPPPKVDWAREIDEEIEKQKRKKKSVNSSGGIGLSSTLGGNNSSTDKKSWGNSSSNSALKNTPLPAPLPKPKSLNSPKVSRNETNTSTSSDLLGLSSPTEPTAGSQDVNKDFNNSDNFTGFLSAPVSGQGVSSNGAAGGCTVTNKEQGVNTLAKDEEDFFNQTNLNSGDRDKTGKLTKDSILALYGTPTAQTSINLGQFNNNSQIGYNSTFNQPTGAGGYMQMSGMSPQVQQGFVNVVSGTAQNQFGQQVGNGGAQGSLNLAGMPQGLMGPHNPQGHHLMAPPSSMYNAPVMTAPGAFTIANPQLHQQMGMSQQGFAQFPPQVYGGGLQSNTFGNLMVGNSANNTMNQGAQSANSGTTSSTNLNQQFGNLNLGNVWQ